MAELSARQRLVYSILAALLKRVIRVIWSTCRVTHIVGEQHVERVTAGGKAFIPCYWHQQILFGAWYLYQLSKRGIRIGFLVSPSKDGEIATNVINSWGGTVIRGSETRTGAQAMRDMYNLIVKEKISPAINSDGPQGPQHVFKVGDLMLSQLTQAPLLPLAYAASRAWRLNSWDRFLIPMPFSRIAIVIGEPFTTPKGLHAEDLEPQRLQMENTLKDLTRQAEALLRKP
ncbi:MAG TPA: lysophospholipid acyltransferase family protein [Gammaproteobacteria bacterium]